MYTPSSGSDSEFEFDEFGDDFAPNSALALFQHPRAGELRATLTESLPFCAGTLELPADSLSSLVLFYGKGESARRLDLSSNPALSALEHLERTCDPATFGVDHDRRSRDVLPVDEAYGKAGELDSRFFAFNLDVQRAGLLEAVRTGLFTGRDERKAVHAEPCTLNVYGKGSFFKSQSHKDTPSRGPSESMFGSLVLVLPTPHEGGELVLEHQGTKWTVDAAQVLSPLRVPHSTTSRLAYIASRSAVAHELAPVTAGHRLTVTYTLHLSASSPPSSSSPFSLSSSSELSLSLPRLTITHPRAAHAPTLEHALAALLADPTLLPRGGTLGFGLRHRCTSTWPVEFRPHADTDTDRDADTDTGLERLRLRGADAALVRACEARGLRAEVWAVWEWRDLAHDEREREGGMSGEAGTKEGGTGAGGGGEGGEGAGEGRGGGGGRGRGRALIAFPRVVRFDTHRYDDEGALWAKLCRRFDGVLLNARPSDLSSHAHPRVEGNEGGDGEEMGEGEGEGVEGGIEWREVRWVTALGDANRVRTRFAAAYGDEPELGCLDQRMCLLVEVGPVGARGCAGV
ncbi:hypothetical protein GSI_04763 [Ganoderma sinense ZZ0214-1]|uniref:Fe2OG dioxygenase domain-containing protein n=1 Tax=Ganoderma sinense ZZ0214-1 TaxID=1077348 RepID=A0A2G8SHS2_9APHY|nr:hypothetical protein GSI_04763 [Ganoderma sinense ZZ0214-1]